MACWRYRDIWESSIAYVSILKRIGNESKVLTLQLCERKALLLHLPKMSSFRGLPSSIYHSGFLCSIRRHAVRMLNYPDQITNKCSETLLGLWSHSYKIMCIISVCIESFPPPEGFAVEVQIAHRKARIQGRM